MPVEAQTTQYAYIGDGLTASFPFPSLFLTNADIAVYVGGLQQTSGFTVSGAGNATGGSVVFAAPPAVGTRVVLIRDPALSQSTDFVSGQTVLEGVIDRALDKLTMICQSLALKLGNSLRAPDDEVNAGLVFPSAAVRRGGLLGFADTDTALPVMFAQPAPVVSQNTYSVAAVESRQDISGYDRQYMRVVPSVSVWEPWALSPELMPWETQTGQPARVTEAAIRERVRSEARLGVRVIWLKYIEIFGRWFTKPNFALWADRDVVVGSLTPGAYWNTFSALADDFDFLAVVLDECAKNGVFCAIGLGRVGLFRMLQFYQTGVAADGYPGGAALTQAAMMQLAIDRTRLLHDDITARFDAYRQWIIWISPGYEPGDMPTWKVFSTGVTTGAGANVTVKAKGYQWVVTPAQMAQLPAAGASLAARAAFAQDLRDCNAEMWIIQDAVGPGNDYTNARYTFVAGVTLGQLDGVYSRWRRSLDDAGVGMGSIIEHWRMGSEPTTNLTLSSTSGAAITATSAFGFFTGSMVGKYITGVGNNPNGGNARITAVASATQATLDTTVAATGAFAAGAPFSTTNLPQGTFSLNDGYANPYPAEPSRVAQQMAVHAKYSDEICMYGTSTMTVDDTLTLRLPQSYAGRLDFRTRAKALFDDARSRFLSGLLRQRARRARLPIRRTFQGVAATPTGGTYTVTQDRYTPAESFSRLFIRLRATIRRDETANANVNDVAVRLQVNGVNVGAAAVTGGKNGVCNGAVEVLYELANVSPDFTFGLNMTWATAAGNPSILDVEWTVEEFL